MTNFSFGKQRRLLNARAYKAVFDNAQIKVSTQQILMLARPNGLPYSRLGLVIAKKNVRLATERNRIKRVIRESFRLLPSQAIYLDTVVLARRGIDRLDNKELFTMIDKLWRQQLKRAEQKLKKQTLDR